MNRSQRGMTLVELVMTIVIIGIAAAALFSAMASITGRSADPMLRQQSLAAAEAYLEEILLQPYVQADQPTACGRSCFNDVRDYDGLAGAPADADGNALTALAGYGVRVDVTGPNALNGVDALRVDVNVTDPAGQALVLTGYRTCYGEAGC